MRPQILRRDRRLRVAGAITAAVLVALTASGCELQPNDNALRGQVAVGNDGYDVTVVFDQIENLVANSQVMLDNVTIGTVTKIDVVDWQATVELRLLDSVTVPADATFSIGQKTLLGAQFVEVTIDKAASPERLRAGTTVPVSQTGVRPSTEQVLAAASLLLNNGGLSQIATITGEMTAALDQRVPDTKALIKRMNELLEVLDDNKDEMVEALASMDSLAGTLADERDVVAKAVDEFTPGLRALNQERKKLTRTLRTTSAAATSAGEFVALNEAVLLSNLKALRPTLTRLADSAKFIPDALTVAPTVPFPAMTSMNAVRGDYANLFMTLDLSLESLAGQFLKGGLLPGLTGGNPLLDPLLDPLLGQDTTSKNTKKNNQTPTTPTPSVPEDDEPDVVVPEPEVGDAPVCGLLQRLLGGCR